MTPTQIEAVARAIHADEVIVIRWEDLKPWQQAEYRRKARVAIEAYQEARTPISGTEAAGRAGTATHAWARIIEARHQTTEGDRRMNTEKRKARSPETAYLLKVVDSGEDGMRYQMAIHRSLAVPLLQAGLIEPVKPKQYAERLYATRAGKKAAKSIRETDHAE